VSRRVPRGINVWLALLTFCLVFGATAGVRVALATRTEALRQTLASVPQLSSTIAVGGAWDAISTALSIDTPRKTLSEAQGAEITGELRGDLNKGVVRLAPASADWAALTTQLNTLTSAPPGAGGLPVKLEIAYRQPLNRHVRLLSGTFPKPPALASGLPRGASFYPVLQVLVTPQTATQFGLKPGSRLKIPGPALPLIAHTPAITLEVSGIAAPVAPDSAFWTSDATPVAPNVQGPPNSPYWIAGVLAGPGESEALQQDFGREGMNVQWLFPLAINNLTGDQAQVLSDALTGLSSRTLPLSSDISDVSDALAATSALLPALASFISAAQSTDVLLWLLYVSLTAAGLVVLLLTARMLVLRRSPELALIRARGAALWRLAGAVGVEAAVVCVPAAVAGVALAVPAVPAAGPLQPPGATGAWWPLVSVLVFAVGGPAVMVAWRYRLRSASWGRRRAVGRRQPRTRARLVAEVALIAAAVGGILVFRQQGLQAGSGVNLYTSAAPVLIAIPAVIVVFRLYPLVLHTLLRAAARTSRAAAFLGLARAARTALTPALPAFALVLALTVAAFGGMVRDAVNNGEVAASWRTVGADATVTPSPAAPSFTIPAATARAIAGVPGVTHAAGVYQATWTSPSGTQVTGLAVDPAEYAAFAAATEGYPAVPAGLLTTPANPGAPQPVLASPSAAAALGTGTVTLSTPDPVRPVSVRVAGTLPSTPALPNAPALPNTPAPTANPAFIVIPLAALQFSTTPPTPVQVNEMLLAGSGIDRARLATVVGKQLAGGDITFRADVLAGLSGAPLQHGAVTVITLAVVAAAVLGLAIMLLELALGAADREATLARLATMGLGEGQRAWVVALELLPAVIAAAVAAWACALVLPPVVRPVIDLSVFTGSAAAVPLVPDVTAVALPLAGLLVLAAVSLGIEIGAGRRRGAASALRVGE
jgi:putative ABC transport system permease protein